MGGAVSHSIANRYSQTIWVKCDVKKKNGQMEKYTVEGQVGFAGIGLGTGISYDWNKIKTKFTPVNSGDFKELSVKLKDKVMYVTVIAEDDEIICDSLPIDYNRVVVTKDAQLREAQKKQPMKLHKKYEMVDMGSSRESIRKMEESKESNRKSYEQMKKNYSEAGMKWTSEISSLTDEREDMEGREHELEASKGKLKIGIVSSKTDYNIEQRVQTLREQPYCEFTELKSVQPKLPGNIREYIRTNGVKSTSSSLAIKMLCAAVEEKYFKDKIKKWIPGYECSNPVDLVLVAIVTDKVPNVPQFLDFRLIQRKFGDVSDEAQNCFEKEKDYQYRLTSQESRNFQICITENAETLMLKHSNLLIVRGSKVRPYHQIRPELCIVLYVHVKGIIPFGEDPFPKKLGGYPVEVLEGIFHFSANPKAFIPSLMMGCYFESAHKMAGSLGGFVKLNDGSLGCLTACHIFRPHIERENFMKDVYQPNAKPHFKFGEVINHSFAEKWNSEISVDAALIRITDERRFPTSGRFPDAESTEAGFSPENPMLFNCGTIVKSFEEIQRIGCTVSMYGAASEHTVGHLNQLSVAVRGFEDTLEGNIFCGQMEIIPLKDRGDFAKQGDSGCLTFLISNSKSGNPYAIHALGMYIGSYFTGGCLVTPIWAILKKFDLPPRLLSFPIQQQEEAMEEENLQDKVPGLEHSVHIKRLETYAAAISNIADNVGRFGSEMEAFKTLKEAVKTLQDSFEQLEAQMINDKYQKDS